jgi:hypothetical protein
MAESQTNGTVDRKTRIEALRKQVEAEEAQSRVAAEEAEERALNERLAAAKLANRRSVMHRMVDHFRKAAELDGSYIVDSFDMETETPGAGLYVIRSPEKGTTWKDFQAAIAEAGSDSEKVDRAYNNLASKCILWTDAPSEGDAWTKHKEKYAVLVQAIGDAAGRLGGAADRARKR